MTTNTTVPLNKLLLSPRNVRKTNADEDIDSLADSIRSKGLLQNLVVSEAPGGKGFYEVDAGGRRLNALERLARAKHIPRNHPVPVIVVPRDDATEASLAENLQKIAMNPADEVEAFAAILERYADPDRPGGGIVDRADQVANLARRFGRDVRYVEQRLRLAALAPEILDALREGRITLDAARAYAAVADQKLQMKVFTGQEKAIGAERHRPAAIRAAYAGKVYRRGDRIVRFVGLESYLKAGGRCDVDLFMGVEDEELLLDTALLDRLAKEKADAEADRVAQAAGWRAGVYVPLTAQHWAWPKPPPGFGAWDVSDLSAGEQAEAVAILKLADDGSALQLTPYYFRPLPAPAAGGAAPARPAPAARGPESEIDRLARIRREAIERRAVRLAAPSVAGSGLDGRAFWPADHIDWVHCIERQADGDYVVALLVTIPAADVEARLAAAEREVDGVAAPAPAAHDDDWQEAEELATEAVSQTASLDPVPEPAE